MSTISANVTPGHDWVDGETVTYDKLRAAAKPDVDIDGAISTISIADGAVTKDKLSTDVAGLGLVGGAGAALDVNVDNASLQIVSDIVSVKDSAATHGYAAATSFTNTYSMTLAPAPLAYSEGMIIRFKADAGNSGTVSVNVNGIGVKSLFKNVTTPLAPGDIQTGQIVQAVYDGTNFLMQSVPATVALANTVTGLARNLVIQTNVGTPNSKADLTADEIVLRDSVGNALSAASVSLTLDIGLGVSINGLDAGAEAASTWYYIWVIAQSSGTAAGLLSTSATAPTLPAGYTYKALAGIVRNNGGSNFVSFYQTGKEVIITDTALYTLQAFTAAYAVLAGANLTAFQAAVPPIAEACSGTVGADSGTVAELQIAADVNGVGGQTFTLTGATILNTYLAGTGFRQVLRAQNIAVKATNTNAVHRMSICGYLLK